ncbi:MAG: mechanosensitive ion channel family protein, partial [Woeseia sp.]|nr:mechanosensitive ion channel family protein [Woeseia sp.]
TRWDLTEAIKKRFDKDGISIPFPQRDLHIIKEA